MHMYLDQWILLQLISMSESFNFRENLPFFIGLCRICSLSLFSLCPRHFYLYPLYCV